MDYIALSQATKKQLLQQPPLGQVSRRWDFFYPLKWILRMIEDDEIDEAQRYWKVCRVTFFL